MKQLNTPTFLRLFLFAALITFSAIWLSNQVRNQTEKTEFDTTPFQAELKKVEEQLLKEFQQEKPETLTVHVYDPAGNLLDTKTFTDEHILHHEFLLPDDFEYLATIHNEIYVIQNL
jgi:hypothetical protein